jgi:hypothetical protein
MIKKKEAKVAEKNAKNDKKLKIMEMNGFTNMDKLTKLRLVVSTIFILFTLTIIIAVGARKQAVVAFAVGLIGYLMLFGLMVKLLLVKKL